MKRRITAILCSILCLIGASISCYAEECLEETTMSVPVSIEKDSYFSARLPEDLSGSKGVATVTFDYAVQGSVAANQSIKIDIADADDSTEGIQIALKDESSNVKYANAILEKDSYSCSEITEDGITGNGSVIFDDLTAGTWSGEVKFVIDLVTTE